MPSVQPTTPRAPRLSLRAPVRGRLRSGGGWWHGWTVDISRSGVLFTAPVSAAGGEEIEWVIALSRGALYGPGVPLLPDLCCAGEIVRVGQGPGGESYVAARIARQSVRRAAAHAAPAAVAADGVTPDKPVAS